MTMKRRVGVMLAVFLVAQVFAILIHGFILKADYGPMYGVLLKPMDRAPDWTLALLPGSHLAFAIGFVLLYERFARAPGGAIDGAKFGVLVWLIGPVAMYFIWTAEQPWPAGLVWKQIGLELVAMLAVGALAGKLTPGRAAP